MGNNPIPPPPKPSDYDYVVRNATGGIERRRSLRLRQATERDEPRRLIPARVFGPELDRIAAERRRDLRLSRNAMIGLGGALVMMTPFVAILGWWMLLTATAGMLLLGVGIFAMVLPRPAPVLSFADRELERQKQLYVDGRITEAELDERVEIVLQGERGGR